MSRSRGVGEGRGFRLVQSVDRALTILEAIASEPGGLRLGEVSDRVGLPVQTVQSLLRTLQSHALVSQSGRGAPYERGPGLGLLCAPRHSRRERSLLAGDLVRDLASRTGEAVLLAELSGLRVIGLSHCEGDRALSVSTSCEVFRELHTMATGKLLLAHLPELRLRHVVRGLELRAHTARTITDPEHFLTHLASVRSRGYAENIDESEVGIAALAVGVFEASGILLAALGACLPCVRYSVSARERLLRELQGTARAIESVWQ